jgi:hypothetical protein
LPSGAFLRATYEPTDQDRANLVKTGCTRDEIDRAIEEAVRGRSISVPDGSDRTK